MSDEFLDFVFRFAIDDSRRWWGTGTAFKVGVGITIRAEKGNMKGVVDTPRNGQLEPKSDGSDFGQDFERPTKTWTELVGNVREFQVARIEENPGIDNDVVRSAVSVRLQFIGCPGFFKASTCGVPESDEIVHKGLSSRNIGSEGRFLGYQWMIPVIEEEG
jgi:hypothetical protein